MSISPESLGSPEATATEKLHPDQLINLIIHTQESLPIEERKELSRKGCGGDFTIDVQDDMPVVEVRQGSYVIGVGDTIQTALETALKYHTDPETKQLIDQSYPGNLEDDPFWGNLPGTD